MFVLDVGNNMNQAPAGEKSFFETALDTIKAIMQRKVISIFLFCIMFALLCISTYFHFGTYALVLVDI